MLGDSLKDAIRNIPVLRRSAQFLLKGAKAKKKQEEIAAYHKWLTYTEPNEQELAEQQAKSAQFAYRPLISVVTPTYNTPPAYFKAMVDSVRCQTYENWELILVDDASPNEDTRRLIEEYAALDTRIKYTFLDKGHHIAGATNVAIKQASGEFISLFDHDDILLPNALYEVALALNNNQLLDFIYTDEDKIIDGESLRADPFFKPDWNQDYLYSINYITHFTTIRKNVLETVGYEDGRFNGAQDWELFLRTTRSLPKENIYHIPKILYSWRVHANSTAQSLEAKPYVLQAQKQAISEDLQVKGISNFILTQDELYSAQWKLEFPMRDDKKISIVNTTETNITEAIEESTGDVLILSPRQLHGSNYFSFFGDSLRSDIGFVIPRVGSKREVMKNIRSILSEEVSDYIESTPDSLSYHYYRTTRYNINEIDSNSIVIIEKAKLMAIAKNGGNIDSISDIAHYLSKEGYRHLYNPYINV